MVGSMIRALPAREASFADYVYDAMQGLATPPMSWTDLAEDIGVKPKRAMAIRRSIRQWLEV